MRRLGSVIVYFSCTCETVRTKSLKHMQRSRRGYGLFFTIISPLNGRELFGRFQNWKLINDAELYIAGFVHLRFSFKR